MGTFNTEKALGLLLHAGYKQLLDLFDQFILKK